MDHSADDIIIWDSFRQGNKDALSLLFKRHYSELVRYGLKLCADTNMVNDELQNLFIDIWQQKAPPPVISIKAYLIKALRYKLFKSLKPSSAHKAEAKDSNEIFTISHEAFLIQTEVDRENAAKVIAALQKLPAKQREIIYLRYYLNLSYKEICAIMGIEYQVARNQLSTAIKNMKRVMIMLMVRLLLQEG